MAEPSPHEQLAQGLLAMNELLSTVKDQIVGYKADWVARGFDAAAAEQMAVQYHAEVIRMVFSGVK